MNGALTVRELYINLAMKIKAGYGDHKIYISSDEEGNSFNPCFYGCTTDKTEIEQTEKWCYINYIHEDNADNIVLLG